MIGGGGVPRAWTACFCEEPTHSRLRVGLFWPNRAMIQYPDMSLLSDAATACPLQATGCYTRARAACRT